MQNQEVKNYINTRYERYLDYSKYKCSLQGMEDESVDVLNTVLIDVLSKDEDYIKQLYERKKAQYRELDFFILKLIATYAVSDTAPYRHKTRNRLPIDSNTSDLSRLDLIDEPQSDRDQAGQTVYEMDLVRWIFERLALEDMERCVFEWKFFEGENFSDWPVPSEKKNLYNAFKTVERAIYEILKSQKLTRAKPKDKQRLTKRVEMLVKIFEKCHLKELKSKKREFESILE